MDSSTIILFTSFIITGVLFIIGVVTFTYYDLKKEEKRFNEIDKYLKKIGKSLK